MFTNDDLISSYSQSQAIEDGVLHLVPKEISRDYFRYPVILSGSLMTTIERSLEDKRFMNDYPGVMHDVLFMAQLAAKRSQGESILKTKVTITGAGSKSVYELLIVCGPGDNAEPTITIMFPEDY
jgi:hypothetical protein